uniref:Uncharacterized protein n=1 Tax=viral metagenome TaxID=1070528 RepID=A0A6M3JWL9_9ZZZZ
MTKITVDKETAIRAVCQHFNIPMFGTGDVYYRTNSKLNGVEIEFDFECKHIEKDGGYE